MNRLALSAMIAGACISGTAFGQTNRTAAPRYAPASYYSYYDEGSNAAPIVAADSVIPASATCDTGKTCDSGKPACDLGTGCDSNGCDGQGGNPGGWFGFGLIGTERALNDPWKLCKEPVAGITIGGWSDIGYFDRANNYSFNNYAKHVQLQQQWLYAERIADGSNGFGLGGRIDYVYGTDAPDTQAFGLTTPSWDNTWKNGGAYGNALPQLYGEAAVGNLSVKVGKFFTIIGNEVVQATGNYFYSRQFTFYNAEPFTHTGALTTYKVNDDTFIYNGYVLGWDSGYADNGDAYLGGFKTKVNDTWSVLYSTVMGRFGEQHAPNPNERGGNQSFILMGALSEKLTFISQTDSMFTTNAGGATVRNTFGNINYLIYKVNDRWSWGQRFEWFNFGGLGFQGVQNDDLYNYTVGVNYRASSNLLIRPEVRFVWDKERYGFNEDFAASQAAIGGDVLYTF
ncbi:MAG: outer membrane beta-barrel protein [Planctomycetota bacterium]